MKYRKPLSRKTSNSKFRRGMREHPRNFAVVMRGGFRI